MVVTFVGCCPIFPATSRILGADGQTHSEKVYEKQAVILFHGVSLLCTAWNYICSFVLAQRITITLQLNRFVVVLFYRFPYVSLSRYPSNEILFFLKLFICGCAGSSCYALLYLFISFTLSLYLRGSLHCTTWFSRLPGFRAQAELWCMGWVALWHVGSSWTRDETHVSCVSRWILSLWTMREVLNGIPIWKIISIAVWRLTCIGFTYWFYYIWTLFCLLKKMQLFTVLSSTLDITFKFPNICIYKINNFHHFFSLPGCS